MVQNPLICQKTKANLISHAMIPINVYVVGDTVESESHNKNKPRQGYQDLFVKLKVVYML